MDEGAVAFVLNLAKAFEKGTTQSGLGLGDAFWLPRSILERSQPRVLG